MSRYEVVVGLEVHAQLLTESKLFCGCSTEFGKSPNHNVCPVCLGLPGTLPVINQEAVRMAVVAALALDCKVQHTSVFARKNYFYPDLPKGYQISQFDLPLAIDGHLDLPIEGGTRRVGIIRIHMEEDAGKNVHGVGGDSLVDLNRAGVPLIEIVSAPDLRSAAEAAAYMRSLREVLLFLGVNDGNLEEGSLRCDANVSIRLRGATELGTRCELKNLNSFRFVQRAIESEVSRQVAIVDSGGHIEQETRAFDPDTGLTRTLRSKEEAHDYRYFPEPDLPPLMVSAELVDEERMRLPELPEALRLRWVREHGLSEQVAATLAQHPDTVRFFREACEGFPQPVKVANFLLAEVFRTATTLGRNLEFTVTPGQVIEILRAVEDGEISGKQAKELFALVERTQLAPRKVAAERGMRVMGDLAAIEALCQEILAKNPRQVAQYRSGKKGVVGFFVGQVMQQTGGSADPKAVNQTLVRFLEREA